MGSPPSSAWGWPKACRDTCSLPAGPVTPSCSGFVSLPPSRHPASQAGASRQNRKSPGRRKTRTLSRNIRAYGRTPRVRARAARGRRDRRARSVVVERIDWDGAALPGVADPDLEMIVGPGGPAAHPDMADELAAGDVLPDRDVDGGHVAVLRVDPAAVGD